MFKICCNKVKRFCFLTFFNCNCFLAPRNILDVSDSFAPFVAHFQVTPIAVRRAGDF